MYKLIKKKRLGSGMAFERLRRFEKKVNEASQQKKNDKPVVKETVETKPVPKTPVVEPIAEPVSEPVVEQMEIQTEPVVENQVEERLSKRNRRKNIKQNIDDNELSNNLSIIAENNNTNTENNE